MEYEVKFVELKDKLVENFSWLLMGKHLRCNEWFVKKFYQR
jgi:hypothetical protein